VPPLLVAGAACMHAGLVPSTITLGRGQRRPLIVAHAHAWPAVPLSLVAQDDMDAIRQRMMQQQGGGGGQVRLAWRPPCTSHAPPHALRAACTPHPQMGGGMGGMTPEAQQAQEDSRR
jgi:hypothetical protein